MTGLHPKELARRAHTKQLSNLVVTDGPRQTADGLQREKLTATPEGRYPLSNAVTSRD